MNENENITYQILQDAAKAVVKGKCIAINAYIRKEGIKSITPGKEEQTKYKVSRRKRIIKLEWK